MSQRLAYDQMVANNINPENCSLWNLAKKCKKCKKVDMRNT